MLSDGNARLTAARRLTTRSARRKSGRFLAEGASAVQAALERPGTVVEVFATATALARHVWLHTSAVGVDEVSPAAAAALSETVTPQGVVAVCRSLDIPLADVLARGPRLVAALVEPRDPGNVGTILRSADAAGADAVIVCGEAVDVYNGKAVRASAGSLFHVPVVAGIDVSDLRGTSLTLLATSGQGDTDLDTLIDEGGLAAPTVWLFGTEAHGLPDATLKLADRAVRVPIYGRAESLNLAAAAAVCLYASARAQRRR